MAKSPHLGITHIEESQEDKEVTANAGFDALDVAMNAHLDVSNADENFALTEAQFVGNHSFHLKGATTAARTMTVPAIERTFAVTNDTGNDITVTMDTSPGDEGVTLVDTEAAILSTDPADAHIHKHAGSASGIGTVEHISGHIETPEAKTYTLIQSAPYAMRVNTLTHIVDSGDMTCSLEVNGGTMAGINNVTPGASESTESATGSGRNIAVGDTLTLVVDTLGSPGADEYRFTVKTTRT